VEQRLSLITLGVADLGRAVDFYGRLGWSPGNNPDAQGVAFFQCGGMVVALWNRDELAGDSAVTDSGGWGGVTLAYNVGSREEVDSTLAEAESAGAEIGRPGAPSDWGGYSGLFRDPDGHPWEVAHNPFWTIAEDGSIKI
jgi:catechol 2,3-dioxygenase-like lactoylglutathione lyase family enzyme